MTTSKQILPKQQLAVAPYLVVFLKINISNLPSTEKGAGEGLFNLGTEA